MTSLARVSAWLGLAAVEGLLAMGYADRGTWWHYLLHQLIGWGVGLAVGALVARGPVVCWLVLGQLVSIMPDLLFRFARLPHAAWMDIFIGHISIHLAPVPLFVAFGVLLLGAEAWLFGHYGRGRPARVLALGALVLLAVACLLARDLPAHLSDYPGV